MKICYWKIRCYLAVVMVLFAAVVAAQEAGQKDKPVYYAVSIFDINTGKEQKLLGDD